MKKRHQHFSLCGFSLRSSDLQIMIKKPLAEVVRIKSFEVRETTSNFYQLMIRTADYIKFQ